MNIMRQVKHIHPVAFCLLLINIATTVNAQTIPVGTPFLEDYYRREQLLGRLDSSISFNVRPLHAAALRVDNMYEIGAEPSRSILWEDHDGKSKVQLMPVSMRYQYNSSYPYGRNDGAMIPARGHQVLVSGGIFARYRFLSVQLSPEIVSAENRRYVGYGGDDGPNRTWYSQLGNRIDMPELFGNGAYSKILPGQSSVRLTLDPISLGVSTENLWWGPGRLNSILMSNTAPGFAHITLNTTKPVRTYIGSFEGQIVAGRIERSGFPPSLLGDTTTHMAYLRNKPDTWRYLSGIVLSYQPKWVPGLSVGMARSFLTSEKPTFNSLRDYLPILLPAAKSGVTDDSESSDAYDQQISVFFRWVVPSARAEIYGEYARNDHAWDTRDLTVQWDHTRAYTVGLRKLVPLTADQETVLQLSGEVTQLAVTNTRRIRAAGSWYLHGGYGYTHRGQLLGAGIGPGSNLQAVDISWLRGINQLGLRFERLVHNEDFANQTYNDFRTNWVDAAVEGYAKWRFNRFLAAANIQYIHAFNYQYNFIGTSSERDSWRFVAQDKSNIRLRLGITYLF